MRRTTLFLLALTASLWSVSAPGKDINLPGYAVINFKAGQLSQDVHFINPQDNPCAFRITITLEDGSTVWTADELLAPGDVLRSINLTRELEAGTYTNAVMKYECYNLEDMARLNGAEIKCTLAVE